MEHMTKRSERLNTKQESHAAKRVIGIIFGLIEAVLAFRLAFELLGANSTNIFVKGTHTVTQFFVGIFEGIFSRVTIGGAASLKVFEPATLIAFVVTALVALLVLKLMTPRIATNVVKTEYTESDSPGN